jgi:hypothetical protein
MIAFNGIAAALCFVAVLIVWRDGVLPAPFAALDFGLAALNAYIAVARWRREGG